MTITAIVLAAGESRRMGRSKLDLPWGETTIIGKVVSTLLSGGTDDVLVVTGGNREEVAAALNQLDPSLPVRAVDNREYSVGDMTHSLQVGLSRLGPEVGAVLVALGDQPQIQAGVVASVLAAYEPARLAEPGGRALIAPSYQMRRGHPWLVSRDFWPGILNLAPHETLRDFLRQHASEILYINVDSPGILQDLDTPDEYEKQRPVI